MDSNAYSSIIRLNIGGHEFLTTVDTLTLREPESMLAVMFSGRHTVYKDPEKGYVFIDRDGKHFRYILNWLRGGVARGLSELERLDLLELLEEAEYYQLLGLVEKINEALNKKEDEQMNADLTRSDIIKCIRSEKYINLRGVNLSGLDLSKLDLWNVGLNNACLKNVDFSCAVLGRSYQYVDAENAIFDNAIAISYGSDFTGANLRGARMSGVDLHAAKLRGVNLQYANLEGANLEGANFEGAKASKANLKGANLKGANLEGAYLKGAKMNKANLQGANLRHANLQDAVLVGANLTGADLFGAIR